MLTMVADIITNPDNRASLNKLPRDLQTELQKQFLTKGKESPTLWSLFSDLFSLYQNDNIADMEEVYKPHIGGVSTDADASTTALDITGITHHQNIP